MPDPKDLPPVAVVTGAASGIGRAVCLRLARAGYAVACLDLDGVGARSTSEAVAESGAPTVAIPVDVTSGTEVAAAFSAVEDSVGPPACFVHSAGVLSIAPALELDEAEWRRVIDINLAGTFLCDQAAARSMRRTGTAGSIVNIASVHSTSPGIGLAHYDASKGGVLMLTRNLALELARYGIRVNAVGPGLVLHTRLAGAPDNAYLNEVVPAIPLGRAAEPDDIAGPVAFLCSDEAAYVTGVTLYVDGGMLLTART